MTDPHRHSPALAADYSDLLAQIKDQVRTARLSAARAVNVELIALYWRIGRLIQQRQDAEGWGTRVIDRLAEDLRAEFPGMRGLSQRNLIYMRSLATAWPEQITQQPAARLPWGHLILLLDRLPEPAARNWYADQAVQHGWSRASLTHHIAADRRSRLGVAPNNFPATLPPAHSDLAAEIVADPYNLDFLALDPGHSERQLEDAIVARLSHFLTELGAGFAFVGRQYRLPVGDQDYSPAHSSRGAAAHRRVAVGSGPSGGATPHPSWSHNRIPCTWPPPSSLGPLRGAGGRLTPGGTRSRPAGWVAIVAPLSSRR